MKNEEDNLDRKQSRRKKIQNKSQKKDWFVDDEYLAQKKSKHNIREIKENLEEQEWEDWDRYYNH